MIIKALVTVLLMVPASNRDVPPPDPCAKVAAFALAAGLPPKQLPTALRIAHRESRCSSAFNPNDPNGGSYGHYQINGFWCRPNRYWPEGWLQAKGILDKCTDLYQPDVQAAAMVAIYRNSGWIPWSTR
jgi:hypothetical protein